MNENIEEITLQPMKCELNYLSKSDGSAFVAQGDNVVIASVNGPVEIKYSSQIMDRAAIEVLFLSKSNKPNVGDRYKENVIQRTCKASILEENYPRSGIFVTVQEVEDSGGLLACCINTVCLALLNSGIAMKSIFGAVMCTINEDGNITLDPTQKEMETAQATMTFVFDNKNNKNLITSIADGKYSENAYFEALEKCRAASTCVFDFYREIVSKYSNII